MNSFPVIARELLVSSRRPATYRHRVIAAAAAISAVALIFTLYPRFTTISDLSQWLFVSVSILGFAYSFLSGALLTSDSICSERRDGTLPLLLLTPLNGFDVMLCKLVATSLVAGGALLAILPVLGFPVLLGGVTGGEFARVALAILLALLFSLTTGLLCSTVCRNTLSAMSSTFGILLLLTGAFWVFGDLTGVTWATDLFSLNPMAAFVNAFDKFHRRPAGPERYWAALVGTAGLTLMQFVIASLLVRRFQFPSEVRKSAMGPRSAIRRRVEEKPYEWLLLRDRFPSPAVRTLFDSMTAAWAGCLLASFATPSRKLTRPLYILTVIAAITLHLAFKGLVIFRVSSRLAEDRHSGALELLLTTRLTASEIVAAHRRALWHQLRPLFTLLLGVNLVMSVTLLLGREQFHLWLDDAMVYVFCFGGGAVLLLVDFILLPWAAMVEGLRSEHQHRAVLGAMIRGLAPSWLALFGFTAICLGDIQTVVVMPVFFWLWAIGSTIVVLIIALNRELELRKHFRTLATGDNVPHEPAPPTNFPITLLPQAPPPLVNAAKG